jgi:hypothetical protein
MPVKRRTPKRRASIEAEVKAWSDMFETGHDFFDELADFGVDDPRASAESAWARLGPMFMRDWKPSAAVAVPWAYEKFGAPR